MLYWLLDIVSHFEKHILSFCRKIKRGTQVKVKCKNCNDIPVVQYACTEAHWSQSRCHRGGSFRGLAPGNNVPNPTKFNYKAVGGVFIKFQNEKSLVENFLATVLIGDKLIQFRNVNGTKRRKLAISETRVRKGRTGISTWKSGLRTKNV